MKSRFCNNWLRTGDIGHFDSDNFLYIDGRIDDMINVGGEKVYPIEIENTIKQIDAVRDVVIIANIDRIFGEVPVAFVSKLDSLLTPKDLEDLCNKNLARYKRPKEFRFIDLNDFPRSTTGKIQRHEMELLI